VESQTALVRTEGGVELHTVSTVDLELAVVILPDDAELNDALGDRDDLQSGPVLRVLLEEGALFEGRDQLCKALVSTEKPEQIDWVAFQSPPPSPPPRPP
jgi:hypothetical protein